MPSMAIGREYRTPCDGRDRIDSARGLNAQRRKATSTRQLRLRAEAATRAPIPHRPRAWALSAGSVGLLRRTYTYPGLILPAYSTNEAACRGLELRATLPASRRTPGWRAIRRLRPLCAEYPRRRCGVSRRFARSRAQCGRSGARASCPAPPGPPAPTPPTHAGPTP